MSANVVLVIFLIALAVPFLYGLLNTLLKYFQHREESALQQCRSVTNLIAQDLQHDEESAGVYPDYHNVPPPYPAYEEPPPSYDQVAGRACHQGKASSS